MDSLADNRRRALKADLDTLIRLAGLPEPKREFRFHKVRRWRFDYAWEDLMLALEREGSTWKGGRHTSGSGYRQDCIKYSEAAILGWVVLRVTVDMIRDGTALDLLQRAVRSRT